MAIKKLTLAEQTYSQLKKDIILCKYEVGQKLLLKDLVEELGVSVTPLREAINRLVQDGFVEYTTNQGIRLKELSLKDVDSLLTIRNLYDQYSIRKIMEQEDRTHVLKELQRTVDKQVYFSTHQDEEATYEEISYNFHSALCAETNNEWMIRDSAKINNLLHLADQRWKSRDRYPTESIEEHQAIVDEIRNGTEESAIAALQSHLAGEKLRFGIEAGV
jgi:DNA-binding GntR family transcriptional regulator